MKSSSIIAALCAAACAAATAGAAVTSSVFDDVKVWYKGSAGNAVGTADSSSYSVTKVKSLPQLGDTSSPMHGGEYYWWGWRMSYENQPVFCPYANVALASTPCMVVRSEVTTNSIETVTIDGVEQEQPNITYRTGTFKLTKWFADISENCRNYTVVLRFRNESVNPQPGTQNRPFNIGAVWTGTAGAAAGIDFRMTPTGKLSKYAVPRFVVGTDQSAEYDDIRIKDGAWVDCAIVVDGATLTAFFCYEDEGAVSLKKVSKTYSASGPLPSVAPNAQILIGGNNTAKCTFTRGVGLASGSTWTYGFRGAFHQIAFWDRTLSDDEIREAMAGGTGRPGLVDLGMEGNGIAEFAATPAKTSVATDGDWENLNPSLTAANPTATISFDCPALWAGLPQWLRIAGAGAGTVSISLNGETLGEANVPASGAASFFVPEGKIASGANTLVLARLSGAPVLDAVRLGGSWRFGESISSFTDGSTTPDQFLFHPACGTDKFHERGLNCGNGKQTHFDFFVPENMVGKFRGILATRAQNTSGAEKNFHFYANGQKVEECEIKGGVTTEVKVPETAIVAGWNRLSWESQSGGDWANINWHKFTLRPAPNPFTLILR